MTAARSPRLGFVRLNETLRKKESDLERYVVTVLWSGTSSGRRRFPVFR